MKYVIVATTIILASVTMAEAKGGKQIFNSPYEYDYSREHKPGYVKDYCEDAVGNHFYCISSARSAENNAYRSTWQSK